MPDNDLRSSTDLIIESLVSSDQSVQEIDHQEIYLYGTPDRDRLLSINMSSAQGALQDALKKLKRVAQGVIVAKLLENSHQFESEIARDSLVMLKDQGYSLQQQIDNYVSWAFSNLDKADIFFNEQVAQLEILIESIHDESIKALLKAARQSYLMVAEKYPKLRKVLETYQQGISTFINRYADANSAMQFPMKQEHDLFWGKKYSFANQMIHDDEGFCAALVAQWRNQLRLSGQYDHPVVTCSVRDYQKESSIEYRRLTNKYNVAYTKKTGWHIRSEYSLYNKEKALQTVTSTIEDGKTYNIVLQSSDIQSYSSCHAIGIRKLPENRGFELFEPNYGILQFSSLEDMQPVFNHIIDNYRNGDILFDSFTIDRGVMAAAASDINSSPNRDPKSMSRIKNNFYKNEENISHILLTNLLGNEKLYLHNPNTNTQRKLFNDTYKNFQFILKNIDQLPNLEDRKSGYAIIFQMINEASSKTYLNSYNGKKKLTFLNHLRHLVHQHANKNHLFTDLSEGFFIIPRATDPLPANLTQKQYYQEGYSQTMFSPLRQDVIEEATIVPFTALDSLVR